MHKKIAILMGGNSSENEVSRNSASACLQALQELGHDAFTLEVAQDSPYELFKKLQKTQPEIVFNALHGGYGEDGTIAAILEYLSIKYTHSGVLASALAMDKARAKAVVASKGVKVAPSVVVNRFDIGSEHIMPPPYVIKPLYEGSSFGVIIVDETMQSPPDFVRSSDWAYGDMVLVEAYIAGRELSCAVMGNEALDVCEILVENGHKFYNLEAKYDISGSKHVCPAKISPNIYKDVQIMSLAAHLAIGCRGVTRSDFRYDEAKNELIWLEINTQPGMTPTSLLPDIAKVKNISFNELVNWIVEDASCNR